jgi:hypothetical protein
MRSRSRRSHRCIADTIWPLLWPGASPTTQASGSGKAGQHGAGEAGQARPKAVTAAGACPQPMRPLNLSCASRRRGKSLKKLASRKGFEPLTPRLGISCSILLSYRDVCRDGAFRRAGRGVTSPSPWGRAQADLCGQHRSTSTRRGSPTLPAFAGSEREIYQQSWVAFGRIFSLRCERSQVEGDS